MIGGMLQIALRRRRRADADAFIGQAHMHRIGVGGRMHRDGGDAHLLAGAVDAQRDFAAIGDQDFFEHRQLYDEQAPGRIRPAAHRECRFRLIVPPRGARMGFIVFMASTMRSVSPSFTTSPTLTKGGLPRLRREIDRADHGRGDRACRMASRVSARAHLRPVRWAQVPPTSSAYASRHGRWARAGATRERAGRPARPRFRSARFRPAVPPARESRPTSMAMLAFAFPPLESRAPSSFTSLMFMPFNP